MPVSHQPTKPKYLASCRSAVIGLVEWISRWQQRLGAPRVAPYYRQSRTSRQYDEYASCDDVFKGEMEAIEKCVEQLSLHHRQAIVTEMRKRETQYSIDVIRFSNNYTASLNAVLTLLVKEELLHLDSCWTSSVSSRFMNRGSGIHITVRFRPG